MGLTVIRPIFIIEYANCYYDLDNEMVQAFILVFFEIMYPVLSL